MNYILARGAAIFILAVAVFFSVGSHIKAELHSHTEIVRHANLASTEIKVQKTLNKKQAGTLKSTNLNKPKPPSQQQEKGLFLISIRMWLLLLPVIYQSSYISFFSDRVKIYLKKMEEIVNVWNSWNLLLESE